MISAMSGELRILTNTISELKTEYNEDRRVHAEERRRFEATIADLTATVAALIEGRAPLHSVTGNASAQNQHPKRGSHEALSPRVSKRPRRDARTGSSAATTLLLRCTSDDLTVVRFGTAEWVADVHQLRAQVYVVGRPAWDSVDALYATLRRVYRDEEDLGYVCLEFPTRGMAELFVGAWANNKAQSEAWADAKACIL